MTQRQTGDIGNFLITFLFEVEQNDGAFQRFELTNQTIHFFDFFRHVFGLNKGILQRRQVGRAFHLFLSETGDARIEGDAIDPCGDTAFPSEFGVSRP